MVTTPVRSVMEICAASTCSRSTRSTQGERSTDGPSRSRRARTNSSVWSISRTVRSSDSENARARFAPFARAAASACARSACRCSPTAIQVSTSTPATQPLDDGRNAAAARDFSRLTRTASAQTVARNRSTSAAWLSGGANR